jgi:hypothetical protein
VVEYTNLTQTESQETENEEADLARTAEQT